MNLCFLRGGYVAVGTRTWFGGKHTSKHLKIITTLSVRNG
jgi:hypothetical protein